MSTYGAGNITINLYLQAVKLAGADFTTALYLVDQATNSLNGDRYVTYQNTTDVTTAETAGYISAAVSQALQDAFAQSPTPQKILVGRVDTAGGEGYDDGLTAVIAAGAGFYGIAIDKRTSTEILAVSAAVESLVTDNHLGYLFVFQSADADWLTASYPAAFTAVENREQTAICYHDTATEYMDLCWLVNRLVHDPDERSAPWPSSLKEVADYATVVTSTQKGHTYTNHVNLGALWGAAAFWVDPGHNAAGRPLDQIVSKDWFRARLWEDITTLVQDLSAKGIKLAVNAAGQNTILGLIRKRLQQGVAAVHFDETQKDDGTDLPRATAITITDADITAQRLRFDVEAVFATSARVFTLNVYLQQTA
jgi:hypothetical protein